MPTDLDIYRSAAVFLRQHGAAAEQEAQARAHAFGAKGDGEGQAVWRRILVAIRDLQRTEPDRMH